MDVTVLLQQLSSAVADAQAKAQAQQKAHDKMTAALAAAKAQYDAAVMHVTIEFQGANSAYQDAKIAVDRLKAQANEALGGLFAAADARVRIG